MCNTRVQEKEARLAHMRKQARERDGIEGFSAEHHSSTNAGEDESRHSNLFADIQHGVRVPQPLLQHWL